MYAEYKEKEIYKALSAGFESLRIMARMDLKRRWAHLDKAQRLSAARGLVQMGAIARQPANYFSRKSTEDAWLQRANEYVREKNIAPADAQCAFMIVPSPTDLAVADVQSATFANLWRQVYNFSRLAQNWEYGRTSHPQGNHHAAACSIVEASREYQHLADMAQSNPVMRVWKNIKHQFTL